MSTAMDEGGAGGAPVLVPGWMIVGLGWNQPEKGRWVRYLFRRRKTVPTPKPEAMILHLIDDSQATCLFCFSQNVVAERLKDGRTGARCQTCSHLTHFVEG